MVLFLKLPLFSSFPFGSDVLSLSFVTPASHYHYEEENRADVCLDNDADLVT